MYEVPVVCAYIGQVWIAKIVSLCFLVPKIRCDYGLHVKPYVCNNTSK